MIFCPTPQDYTRLKKLLLPIPAKLLELLFTKGLGIWVVRGDLESSKFLYTNLGRELVIWAPDTRYPHEAPHYHIFSKQIAMTRAHLYNQEYNVLLHELGHAVDCLLGRGRNPLSNTSFVKKKLMWTPHLNQYTETVDTERGSLLEHFATCFSAYFSEPVDELKHGYHCIDELHPVTREYFKRVSQNF